MVQDNFSSNDREIQAQSSAVLEQVIQNGIKDEEELLAAALALTGERYLLCKPVCKGHSSPFDFIKQVYFEEGQDFLVIGPREGYKTKAVATLNALELLTKPRIEIGSIGAIEKQTKRGYRFTAKYLAHQYLQSINIVVKQLLEEVILANSSRMEMLTATINGVNSPHPNKVRVDEFELMDYKILEEMKMMASSFNGWKKGTVYITSWKWLSGNVSKMMAEHGRDIKTLIWCYKEISENCPDERSGTTPVTYEIEDIHKAGNTLAVQAYDGCADCPLLVTCRGDLKRANGITPIDDIISSFKSLDLSTFIAQKESNPPGASGDLVYEFNEVAQVGDFKLNKSKPFDIMMDPGGGAKPLAVLLLQDDENTKDVFCVWEYFSTGHTNPYDAEQVRSFCLQSGVSLRHQICDSAAQQAIIEWNAFDPGFFRFKGVKKNMTNLEMISHARSKIRNAYGEYKYFIDRKCINHIREFQNYSKRPGSEEPNDKDDHSMDCMKYYFISKLTLKNPRVRTIMPGEVVTSNEAALAEIPEAVRGMRDLSLRLLEDDD